MSRLSLWLRASRLLPPKNPLPPFVTLGRYSHGVHKGSFLFLSEEAPVKIGAFCAIAAEVLFICHADHPTETASNFGLQDQILKTKKTIEYLRTKGPIVLGNDVWVGARATILSGVTIGDGAVVAACSVVTKDVPPYAIVAGNPAKLIRYRFPADTIAALREIRWWDWPIERIKQEKSAFELPAEEFVRRFS
ncbi:chloramphenicol acetyltransferase [Mesorhizobium japonicum MAFF 303099]|uniref:Chloramphenicol acetyltransferase n=1 Tax=Mesorhizobium japonicum (strain LMG 29417 / CECT 9101 / MAFF 303099) TaxID=266835 RepID=Q98DH5_RHILO|nr:chloramphenicol acetyltransferase [Mesorhizobium japonicum MAFF 303099]